MIARGVALFLVACAASAAAPDPDWSVTEYPGLQRIDLRGLCVGYLVTSREVRVGDWTITVKCAQNASPIYVREHCADPQPPIRSAKTLTVRCVK